MKSWEIIAKVYLEFLHTLVRPRLCSITCYNVMPGQ
ncbi:hypothetical protein KPSA1_03440 [Pseudomonas syringae pv. actinidiae]|uniref:Uncharacterized protein n=1 Tax=Pseudomonas syringae pv. actinidiae TaxID=103796 RepID=A0A2V0QAB5_PSESF|nr:hypothetical protein KPSA1_03440 [Pseudomonas syringae pv. actinidiae]